jgi:serine/threonine protein kinase
MWNTCPGMSRAERRAEGKHGLQAGARLGPYEILSLLGSGGMGEVYRARDMRLGRQVALKILPEALASDPSRLARFEREARAASSLSDPHTVAVFDVGLEGAIPYFVSELVEGETLRGALESRRLSLPRLLDLAGQIASGLAAAHEQGIVHRDLKPENILISRSGVAKVADFGLARLTESEEPLPTASEAATAVTETGVVVGTVGYIAPEQVRGEIADERADIFSFGCVLYEMATGSRAFEGESHMDKLASILRDDPPPVSTLDPSLPAELDRIIGHCLEKNPAQRFQSARDLCFALQQVPSRSPQTPSQNRKSGLSYRFASAVGVGLGLLRTILLTIP